MSAIDLRNLSSPLLPLLSVQVMGQCTHLHCLYRVVLVCNCFCLLWIFDL